MNYKQSEPFSQKVFVFLEFVKFVKNNIFQPFIILETDQEDKLLKILGRSVLAISLYELWVSSSTFEKFFEDLKSCQHVQEKFYKNCSFRINVETFGKKTSLKSKVEKIETLSFLPFEGPIKLNDPDVTFQYFEYFHYNDSNNIPKLPHRIFFGKWVADSNRKFVSEFSLKKRKFIANTSMDATLSFVMCNIAQVHNNDIVYDPFVGSGSLLVSAAYYGAYVCGVDIDYLLLHGLTRPSRCGIKKRDNDESVLANLEQYKLQSKYLDIICADSSLPLLRNEMKFDSIITDPPYGKRESRERIGTSKNYKIPEELVANHIPSKLEYCLEDIYKDLLNFASKHLKPNKRILFWVPYSCSNQEESQTYPQINFFRDDCYDKFEQELKEKFSHPKLRFLYYASQNLTCKYFRILIVMELID